MTYQVVPKLLPPGVNHWVGRAGQRPRAIVWHVAEGGRAGVESWFRNPASQASTHYLVNRDGTVWQFLNEADSGWANGRVARPRLTNPVVAALVNSGVNPNRQTIAIETERFSRERLTADSPMGRTLVALTRDIMVRHGIPIDDDHVLGHNELDGVDRANCPGDLDWDSLLAALKGRSAAAAPAPNAVEHFAATGQTVRGAFLAFWRERGGLPLFGYPLTGEIAEGGRTTQWFERARFELHPGGEIILGRVGAELREMTSDE